MTGAQRAGPGQRPPHRSGEGAPGEARPGRAGAGRGPSAGPSAAVTSSLAGLADNHPGRADAGGVLELQRTFGNRAVAGLIAGAVRVQRQPGVGGSQGSGAPVDAATALFGESDVRSSGPPIGDARAETMSYPEVQAELRRLGVWVSKQTRSTTADDAVQARMLALERRSHDLGTATPSKRGHKPPAGPRPRTLDPGFNPLGLSKQDAVAELAAIVEYLRTSPPRAERRKLGEMRVFLEQSFQAELDRRDEGIRQRDILAALTPRGASVEAQLHGILTTIDGIHPDPDAPGQWLLAARGMQVPLADEEVKSIRAEARRLLAAAITESAAMNENAYLAFEERRHKNNEHPVVHGLVKFSTGVDDLDELEIFGRKETGRSLEHQATGFLRQGHLASAFKQAVALNLSAEGLADTVAVWESSLMKGAGRWVLALTVLKEGLTLLATAGAAGLTTKMAKGVGYVRAALTVGGATTAAGAVGAGGAATVSGLVGGDGPSARDIGKAIRVGAGTGLVIGATPGAVGGAKQLLGVKEGLAAGNLVRATAAEAIGNTGVNATAAAITGESVPDAIKGSLAAAPINAIGGAVVGHMAHDSKAIASVGGAVVGGGSGVAGALAQGKDTGEVLTAGVLGMAGGALTPHLAGPTGETASNGEPAPAGETSPTDTDVHGRFDVSDVQAGAVEAGSSPEPSKFDLSDVAGPEPAAVATGDGQEAAPVAGVRATPEAGGSTTGMPEPTVGAGDVSSGATIGTAEPSGGRTVGTAEPSGGGTGATGDAGSGARVAEERWLGRPANDDLRQEPGPRGIARGEGAAYEPQAKGRFRTLGQPSTGISESVIVQDQQSGKKFLFKPQGGEKPVPYAEARGVTAGNIAPRAKAAEIGAQALGVETPHVELVEINGRKGSLTEWVEGTQTLGDWATENPAEFAALKYTPEFVEAMSSIHALDYLINNLDRVQNTNNYLIEFADGKFKALIPIDSELSFTSTEGRAIIPKKTSGLPRSYSPELAARIERLHADPSAFVTLIEPLVGTRAIPGVQRRLNELYADAVAKGAITPGTR